VQLYAFDILALDGDDLRKPPLHLRKTNLRAYGIHLAPFEQGEIGADLFKAACNMMLERLRDSSIGLARRGTGSRSKILPHLR
jgi:bifunctional non-homologous end joining protein LigD